MADLMVIYELDCVLLSIHAILYEWTRTCRQPRLKFSEMYITTNPACVAGGAVAPLQVERSFNNPFRFYSIGPLRTARAVKR
jgi:hypothetical protein